MIFGRKGGFGYGPYGMVFHMNRSKQIFEDLTNFSRHTGRFQCFANNEEDKTSVAKNLRKNESLERTTIYVWVGDDQLWTTNRL